MKIVNLIMLLVVSTTMAQIKGNGQIITQNYPLEDLSTISIQMYAKVTIDPSAKEGMTITADSNLQALIGKEIAAGTLTLDQVEWIQPSQDIIISIGAPELKEVIHGTHDKTSVINLDQSRIDVTANVGEVVLSGKVEQLYINSKLAAVNAADLIAQNAEVVISGRGTVNVNVQQTLNTDLDKNAELKLVNEPATITGNYKPSVNTRKTNPNLSYVSFTLKNNSWNRNNFYVVGPNPDGSSFSYGFPIMPGAKRAERWSVGTKVYLDKRLGKRELLYTVIAADEGAVVKLFE